MNSRLSWHCLIVYGLYLPTIFPFDAFSQPASYQPLLENGKTWDVFHIKAGWIVPYDEGRRYVLKDTVAYLGKTYTRLWFQSFIPVSGPLFLPPFFLANPIPYGLIREDTLARQVFVRYYEGDWSLSPEVLTYDFSLAVGDTLQSWTTFTMDSLGSTTIETGEQRRTFYFAQQDLPWPSCTYYIEGIGGDAGLWNPLFCPFEDDSELVCVKHNDTVLYAHMMFQMGSPPCDLLSAAEEPEAAKVRIWPNPATDRLFLDIAEFRPVRLRLYDAGGRLLLEQPAPEGLQVWEVDLSRLQPGYLFGILAGEEVNYPFRFIKMKSP